MTPLFVITRDRVSYTRLCIASLERFADSSKLEIHIVDHGSTYGPMLDYLDGSPHPVHRCGSRPPRALWAWNGLSQIATGYYLVTDPDIVIDDACPPDWLHVMDLEARAGLMPGLLPGQRIVKIGLSIRIDDLPDTELCDGVRRWESQFWHRRTPTGLGWRAPVDTTLALYPPLSIQPTFELGPASRLAPPYSIRHLPWYGDLDPEETAHYRSQLVPGSSHWINGGW